MKNNYLKIVLMTMMAGALLSCSKEEDPTPPPPTPLIKLSTTTITVTGQPMARVIKLTAERAWAVTLTDAQKEWIEVTPAMGEKSDVPQNITIRLKKSMAPTQRTADLNFRLVADSVGTKPAVLKIAQGTEVYFERDSVAVIAVYHAWNGPNWNQPWDLTKPLEEWGYYSDPETKKRWNGVFVDTDSEKSRRVYSLWWNEDPGNMTGACPEELGELTFLNGLGLHGFIAKEGVTFQDFTPTLAKMVKLEKLWLLGGCVFNGSTIPGDLARVPILESIYIGDHDFVGYEEGFGEQKFPCLVGITIQSGPFKTPLSPKHYVNMPRLALLSLMDNEIPGQVPADLIAGRISLLGLELRDNHLTGVFPSSIRQSVVFENADGLTEICPQKEGYGFSSGCDDEDEN